jgi:hypothetical protein
MQTAFAPGEGRFVSLDAGGKLCCWVTHNAHQLFATQVLEPDLFGASVWRLHLAENGGHKDRIGSSVPPHDRIDSKRTCLLHGHTNENQQGLHPINACFSASGCEVICFGAQGQVVVMDSLSGAVVSTAPASMHHSTHAVAALQHDRSLSESCLVVDAAGSVCHLIPSLVLWAVCSDSVMRGHIYRNK